MPDALLDSTASSWVDLVVRHLAPEEVIVFGSRATGHARPDSDLDLLVVVSDRSLEGLDRTTVGSSVVLAGSELAYVAQLHIFTPAELAAHLSNPSSPAAQALKLGYRAYPDREVSRFAPLARLHYVMVQLQGWTGEAFDIASQAAMAYPENAVAARTLVNRALKVEGDTLEYAAVEGNQAMGAASGPLLSPRRGEEFSQRIHALLRTISESDLREQDVRATKALALELLAALDVLELEAERLTAMLLS